MAPLVRFMEARAMQNTRITTENDGVITYATETTYQSFSQKLVLEGLHAFFAGQAATTPDEANASAEACMAFLRSRRVPTQHSLLRRTTSDDDRGGGGSAG